MRLRSLVIPFAVLAVAAALAAPAAFAAPAASFDRAFIDAMVPHHRMALEMAAAARKRGLKAPVLKRIAAAISATQAGEIAQMRAWRKAWYGAGVPQDAMAASMDIGLSMDDMGMADDAAEIAAAANADAAFARLMVPHHQGAVRMARLALAKATHPALKQLARAIIAGQTKEIRAMAPFVKPAGS